MRKLTILSAVAIISAVSLTGCGKKKQSDVDSTKAQLTILTYDGGVGDQWLKNAARMFESLNQERTDFEEGKTGVQIHITKQRVGGNTLIDTDLTFDMYFTESINYYGMTNKNKMLDITDILTTANPDDGGKKIIDKVDDNLKAFMNRKGKYYAVPFYDCLYGLVYDKDLFQEKKFYMTDSGAWTNNKAQFGTGPNGVKGDWDDGLPKTYAQFKSLLNQMNLKGVVPFTYSSNKEHSHYTVRALSSYWADDEGLANANLNYTFNGTATDIVEFVNGEPQFDEEGHLKTKSLNITKDNGYELRKQAGVYNALDFAKNTLVASPNNYKPASSVSDAQINFVVGKYQGESVGMVFEGTWWENEAVNAFNMAKSLGADSFNYGIMPIPKSSDDKVGEDATFLNLNESYGFISANTKHKALAKEFFSYLHTDNQLKAFTIETGMTRALNYTLSEAEFENVSTYTKDLINIKQSEHANFLFPYSSEDFFINDSYDFNVTSWLWSTKDLGENPITKFISTQSVSVKDYFKQHVSSMSVEQWNNIIGKK